MKIYLRDKNEALVKDWAIVFSEEADVHVSCGDIFEEGPWLDVQAIVSPANSFGFMDGGIDFIYSTYFGWEIGDLLRALLQEKYDGELLVGDAVVIDMRETKPQNPLLQERVNRIPYLISAPTMRVPSNVSKTVNAYLAFKATLKVAKKHGIESLLCPGLGTAVGQMPTANCAIQMYEAYKHYDPPRIFDVLSNAHCLHYAMMSPHTYVGGGFSDGAFATD